jgi:hypothetical protein
MAGFHTEWNENDEILKKVRESADVEIAMVISSFVSQVKYCEQRLESLDKTVTFLANEMAQQPGLLKQELRQLEIRMNWQMRVMRLAMGVAAVAILLIWVT